MNSLRKSFKRKKNEQQKGTVALSGGTKGVHQKLQSSASESVLIESDETNIQPAKLLASSSTFGSNRSSMYHVQVSSTESLQSLDGNITKNEFIQPDEAIAWLIKPVDTTKFFKYVPKGLYSLLFYIIGACQHMGSEIIPKILFRI